MVYEEPIDGSKSIPKEIDQSTKICKSRWKACVKRLLVVHPTLSQVSQWLRRFPCSCSRPPSN